MAYINRDVIKQLFIFVFIKKALPHTKYKSSINRIK